MTSRSDGTGAIAALPAVQCWVVFPARSTDRVLPGTLLAIRSWDFGSAEYLVLLNQGPWWIGAHLLKGSEEAAIQWLQDVDAMKDKEVAA